MLVRDSRVPISPAQVRAVPSPGLPRSPESPSQATTSPAAKASRSWSTVTGDFAYVSFLVACFLFLPHRVYSQPVLTTVRQEYEAARRLYARGRLCEARARWMSLLRKRGYELDESQKKALKACIARCDAAIARQRESSRSNVDRAAECCRSARPLLRAFLPSEILEKERILKKAVSYLANASAAEKKDPRYDYLMAFAYLHLDEVDKASRYLEAAVKAAPADPAPLALKAQYHFLKDEYSRAIDAADASIGLKDKYNFDAYYWKVRALLARHDPGDEKLAWLLSKRAVGTDDKRADELSRLFTDPRKQRRLEEYAMELVNRRRKQEIERAKRKGPKIISTHGGKAG